MTAVKLCGMRREADIEAVNATLPEYIGFVIWKPSKRYTDPETARRLKEKLDPRIKAVGVFVDEEPEEMARLSEAGIIDLIQLHGNEEESCIRKLRELTKAPILQAIRLGGEEDIEKAELSSADHILLDSGKGGGKLLDWELAARVKRPYFLAGGLGIGNVSEAIEKLHPFAVDVSSGIETDGWKDPGKMRAFVEAVRSGQ